MKYQYWKCFCGANFRTGTQMSEIDVRNHLQTHPKEYQELTEADDSFREEKSKLEKKFEKRYLGFWIKNETPPEVKRKLWKCTRCGEEMTYHYKKFHQDNATRKGKDYLCIVKSRPQ